VLGIETGIVSLVAASRGKYLYCYRQAKAIRYPKARFARVCGLAATVSRGHKVCLSSLLRREKTQESFRGTR
jgi:hypothetical protein